MGRQADVVVLGAGAVGLACAHFLLARGRSVVVLDQGQPGQGSSHGNCGTLTPSHAPPLAGPGVIPQALRWLAKPDAPLRIALRADARLIGWLWRFMRRCNARDWRASAAALAPFLRHARAAIEGLVQREGIDCEFAASGTLDVFATERALQRAQAGVALLRELGIPAEDWDAATLARREPALRPGLAGAVFHPGDAMLRPERYVAGLARRVREQGGRIEEGCHVEGMACAGGRVEEIIASHGRFRAGEVVVALGAWSPLLLRKLGLRLPIQPGKGYSITWSRPALCPRLPLSLREPSVCVTTWGSGFRLGSTMEFAGYDARMNRARLDALRRGAAAFLREPEGPERVEEWWGWRPMVPDDLPLIGHVPGCANLMLATGHGMLGVTLSAATGELVADLLAGTTPAVDPRPFSPARFLR